MSSSDGGSSRVSIPYHLRKTLQKIREYTGKQHSDEDIFAVYKDSFNDPHETAQKLLFLDTFHEVRSKREKKKEPIVPVTQPSGRGGRRNFASSNSYQGSLCSFVDTFQISIVVLFPVLSSLLTFRYR
jgi:uridine kinase